MKKEKNVPVMAKWEKTILALIAFIFIVRIGYIAIRGEVDKAYYTSCSYDLSQAAEVPCKNLSVTFAACKDRLDSLEFVFSGIEDDEVDTADEACTVMLCIYSEDALLYQTNLTLSSENNLEWKRVLINAPLKIGDIYNITLNTNKDSTQVPNVLVVNSSYASEILESYSNNQEVDGNIALNFGYLQFPGRADRLVMISLWIIFYAIIFFGIKNIEAIIECLFSIKNALMSNVNEKVFHYILEMICCLVILNTSGIEFQEMTKIIFYVISFVSVVNYDKKYKSIGKALNKPWKKVLLAVVYLYASFALVGQRTLIYPLTLKLTTHSIFVLFCATIWFVPVVNSVIYYIEKTVRNAFGKSFNIKQWQFIMIHTAILLLPAAYNLFANNPGISSPDTLETMITNAQHLRGMYGWHPPFYCMVLRVIEEVCNSTYAVIAVQYFFWTYVVIELLLYLRKKGLSDNVLIMASVFFGFNAGNFIHLNTIWKDIPHTLSLFWTFVLVAKLSIDFEEYKGKWYIYLELIIALVGDFFYRKNGIVTFVIITCVLLVILRKNKKVLLSLFISVLLINVVKGPVYTYFEIEDPGLKGIYHGLGLDILGAYYSGGEVSDSTLQMINMMTRYNNAEYRYNPTWSYQSYDVDVEPKTFILNYIGTFINNPLVMTRAVIDREDAIWDIYAGQDTALANVNQTGTQDGVEPWNDYYSKRVFRSLYTQMSSATAYTADTQWIAAIEWRCGLLSLLGLICFAWIIIRYGKGKHLVMLSPIGAHIMSLLLSTGWSCFRYFWALNLMNFSLVLLVIVIMRQKEYEKENDTFFGF